MVLDHTHVDALGEVNFVGILFLFKKEKLLATSRKATAPSKVAEFKMYTSASSTACTLEKLLENIECIAAPASTAFLLFDVAEEVVLAPFLRITA